MEKISIIISSYNYENYIESCILSCIHQDGFNDYEIIVVDDGSTDNTHQILQKYSDSIRFYENSNHGLEYELNFAISKAKGDYIVRVDADDKLDTQYLKTVYTKIKRSGSAFVYTEYFDINARDDIISRKELPDFSVAEIQSRGDFLATGTLYKKRELENVGLYNETIKNCGLENYELVLKLLRNNCKGCCIHKPLFYYRHHDKNLSLRRKNAIITYGDTLAEKFDLTRYQTNTYHPWGLKI